MIHGNIINLGKLRSSGCDRVYFIQKYENNPRYNNSKKEMDEKFYIPAFAMADASDSYQPYEVKEAPDTPCTFAD